MPHEVVIVGAGLAGLSCAKHLFQNGLQPLVLEATGSLGGRVRTDRLDGFLLDRGFQVFLTAYPEAKRFLDYACLKLRSFEPGALVRFGGTFHLLADPWRKPWQSLRSILNPIGTLQDKLRIAGLRSRALSGTLDDLFATPETTTLEMLRQAGLSDAMTERFFRPFLGGIFLDRDLYTSSRMFQFVFRMFSLGLASLPAQGMQAIPDQLASSIPKESVRFDARVQSVEPGRVQLANGEEFTCRHIVVAADSSAASQLLGAPLHKAWQGVTCLYFAAVTPPVSRPILVLNGEGKGPINNLCVPSVVSADYAPAGQHLVSVSVMGVPDQDAAELEIAVRDQLTEWYGPKVKGWRHLRTFRIPHALPQQFPPALETPQRPVKVTDEIYVCGDHRDNASINGAMVSGRRAAEAILQARG